MALMRWHFVTSDVFKAGVKDENDLYFLSDSREIYRGSTPFTDSVVMYNELPTTGYATNRLYINSTTLEGKIHNGTEWVTVIKPVDDTVLADGVNPVSGKAVAAFVAAEIAKVSTTGDIINALSWDSADHILTVTKGDKSSETITFDGLGVSLTYSAETGALQLVDASNNPIGDAISLDLERFVTAGEYDDANRAIILYFDAEKTESVSIPVGDLVDTYTAEGDGKALNLTVENNVVKGSIKISTAAGNIITADENGLYVAATDISGKMDKVADAVEGDIAIFGPDGQVIDSGVAFADLQTNAALYTGATIDEAVNGNTPKKGDICVTITPIGETDKNERKAYEYDGTQWIPFDESYNAENVYFASDLSTTSAIGNITLTNGQATISAKGKNLKQVWDSIFIKEKNPSKTEPAVSFTSIPQMKAYEVGETTPAITYTASLSAGKYTYGPATGIVANSWTVTNSDGGMLETNSGTFDAITVTDDTNYTITATASHGDGAIPVTNTGNEYASAQIKAGSKSATSTAITGYRKYFYGYSLTAMEDSEITSAVIRGLQKSSTEAAVAGTSFDLEYAAGTRVAMFAYPATLRDPSSVIDVGGMNTPIADTAHIINVDVADARGGENGKMSYKVCIYRFADPGASSANTYAVTI